MAAVLSKDLEKYDSGLEQYAEFPKLYDERKNTRPFHRQTLSFLDLPVELRIMVYRHPLRSAKPFELWAESGVHLYQEKYRKGEMGSRCDYVRFKSRLHALRLSKKINKEAAQFFYGENAFRFTSVGGLTMLDAFTKNIGPRQHPLPAHDHHPRPLRRPHAPTTTSAATPSTASAAGEVDHHAFLAALKTFRELAADRDDDDGGGLGMGPEARTRLRGGYGDACDVLDDGDVFPGRTVAALRDDAAVGSRDGPAEGGGEGEGGGV